MRYLKQSTATVIEVGPFVDDTDGKTLEEALTVASIDVQLMQPLDTAAVPPDLVTNGTFATDSDWTKNSWTISSGVANSAAAQDTNLDQTISITENVAYEIVFDVVTQSAGSVTPILGTTSGTARSTVATFTETIIAGSGSLIRFDAIGFTGTIDNVIIKQVPIPITPAASGSSNDMVLTQSNTGTYWLELTANQLAILGRHKLTAFISGALIVWEEFMVLPANVFDSLFGTDKLQTDVNQWIGTAVTLGSGAPDVNIQSSDNIALTAQQKLDVNTEVDTALTDYDPPTRTEATSDKDSIETNIAALNDPAVSAIADAVLDEALAGHVAAGSLGKAVADIETDTTAILVDTNELQTDDVPGLIAALNDPAASTIADAVLDEALAGHVVAGSLGKAVTDIETDATTILADTNELQTDDVPGLIAALNDPTASTIADTVWDEAKAGHVGAGSFGEETQAHALSSEISAQNDLSTAEVNAEIVDALDTDTYAELAGVPAATSTLADKINWLFLLARNKLTQTATTQLVRNDADAGTVGTSTVSDDATTAIRGEFI